MAIQFNLKNGSCQSQSSCTDKFGCPDYCPDFIIRRHDTRPALKVAMEDCDGFMDFRGLLIEVNMWALAKLKTAINDTVDYFRLADDIGFEQVMVGDVIVIDRVRLPERMLVIAFDETNKLIQVERGYQGTTASAWVKGTTIRIFRILNGAAEAEMVYEDITTVEGTVDNDVLTGSYLIYDWRSQDTCLPGCYWLEFKVLKMIDLVLYLPGGNWVGEKFQDVDGYYWTGTSSTDSSVKLSYDQVNDIYLINAGPWTGEYHQWDDGNYYTGTNQDDGSVILNKTGVSSSDDTEYTSRTAVFTDPDLTPTDFGCALADGVEWVRRFPMDGEGFLIKISSSPTTEL